MASGTSHILRAGFETGTARAFTRVVDGQVIRAAAKNGTYGLRLSPTKTAAAFAEWAPARAGAPTSYWSFRAYVRVDRWTPGQSVDLITVQNSLLAHNFDFFVLPTPRRFSWDLFRADHQTDPTPVQLNTWYLVQASGHYGSSGSYAATVSIDGVAQPPITSVGQPASAVKELLLGSPGDPQDDQKDYDDLAVRFSSSMLPPVTS